MGILLDQIPAVVRAVARAERLADERRDLALSGVDVRLCGLAMRQLTARHLMHLFAARSPFFFGGTPRPEDVALFLWVVRGPGLDDRARFMRRLASVPYGRAVRAIDDYIEGAIMDRPGGSGPKRNAIAGTFAGIVHELASAYGWSRDTILDSPIAETYQYFRLIQRDANPRAIFFSPADKARRIAYRKWKDAQASCRAARSPRSTTAHQPSTRPRRRG